MSNQDIDGVPRELLSDVFDELTDWNSPNAKRLRALLAKPAEQRQDAPEGYKYRLKSKNRAWTYSANRPEFAEEEFEILPLYTRPAAQPQGEPVALPVMPEMVDRRPGWPEGYLESDNDWCDNNPEAVGWLADNHAAIRAALYTRPAEQPAPGSALKAFANDMINAAFEGGSFDGGDIQDIAVRHGLLRIDQREEECGEVCACRSEGDGFPAECYRKTALLRGEQPAPVAAVAAVPEGWQLVPTVPTDDMIVAFAEAWYSKRQAIDDPDMLDAYRDMLAVAPSPPQQ